MNILKSYFYGDRDKIIDGIEEDLLLNEGLITSYNIQTLKNKIKNYFKDNVEFGDESPLFDYKAYSFHIHVKNYDKLDDKFLVNLLNLFGYYIVKGNNSDESNIKINTITIEPKYPIIINDILKNYNIKYLYHITPLKNLSKIEKYGLAPRGSQTTFYHPEDRIYLLYSSNISYIKAFKNRLMEDKVIKFKMSNNPLMVTLKVPYNDKYKYYLDDSVVTNIKNTYGCFVLQNIPPDEIIKTNI